MLRRAALAGGAALRGLLVGPADLRGLPGPVPDAVDVDDKLGAVSRLTALPAAPLAHALRSFFSLVGCGMKVRALAAGSAAPRGGGGHLPCGVTSGAAQVDQLLARPAGARGRLEASRKALSEQPRRACTLWVPPSLGTRRSEGARGGSKVS